MADVDEIDLSDVEDRSEASEYHVPGAPYERMGRRPARNHEEPAPKFDEHLNALVMSRGWDKLLLLIREQAIPIHRSLVTDYRMDPVSRAAMASSLMTLGKLLSEVYTQADVPMPDGLNVLLNGVIK